VVYRKALQTGQGTRLAFLSDSRALGSGTDIKPKDQNP
jgi:hypothetical protein